jgi:hypothetical protein
MHMRLTHFYCDKMVIMLTQIDKKVVSCNYKKGTSKHILGVHETALCSHNSRNT